MRHFLPVLGERLVSLPDPGRQRRQACQLGRDFLQLTAMGRSRAFQRIQARSRSASLRR
jgi:hypothetical protein